MTPLTTAESEPYFRSRPHGSQIGAWASRQSTVIGSRAELDDRYAKLSRCWPEGTDVPMPDFWGGYLVIPEVVEFWQGLAQPAARPAQVPPGRRSVDDRAAGAITLCYPGG